MPHLVPHTEIETIIHEIRGKKVILDSDLAAHHGGGDPAEWCDMVECTVK